MKAGLTHPRHMGRQTTHCYAAPYTATHCPALLHIKDTCIHRFSQIYTDVHTFATVQFFLQVDLTQQCLAPQFD